ncbi:hypothetical protein FRC08_014235 [Ceratobasidium sp. 394]|nr:hypothetical protein FRC08_014235 [Ceratobasidium sp. 394]
MGPTRSNPGATPAQVGVHTGAAKAWLATIKDGWCRVRSHLVILPQCEAEALVAFVCTLGTSEVDEPPGMPISGTSPTSPHLPIHLPVLSNILNQVRPHTFLPPLPMPVGDRPDPQPSGTTGVDTHIIEQAPMIPTTQNLPINVSTQIISGTVIRNVSMRSVL